MTFWIVLHVYFCNIDPGNEIDILYTVHDNCTQVLTIVFVDWKPADSTYNLSVYENSILYCIYMNGFDMRKYNSGVGSTGYVP